ncbi:GIY-YIG nuclease family protein (plasmid) [Ensifer adhaerens]|uniref:GIY-YIG nuclease family protein n=1 Tax=Sinorhizobium/Ensifer group TaxID=227292 RepID=UPI000FD9F126|nr:MULTISPECIES: GIY-YIG nuclease family protein [Sinorhizobium/Ensifer group]RVK16988.1 GIY-YIG nuclease family protein [Sinorhizobium meliloti]WDZ82101.1 GIY-YIG nuclease family protein [Ensifer adhaerens]
MTKADQIRALAAAGLKTAEIAKQMGIRYQHAYNVLNGQRLTKAAKVTAAHQRVETASMSAAGKPPLSVEILVEGGFRKLGRWMLSGDSLVLEGPVPKEIGVYAFVKAGIAQYVGVATMGLSKRLYFYGRPGISQRTSQRLNAMIKAELLGLHVIEIYVASPPDLEWSGLPVHGSAGLELGLIKKFALPWNMRSTGLAKTP